jgi:hypothetical protein
MARFSPAIHIFKIITVRMNTHFLFSAGNDHYRPPIIHRQTTTSLLVYHSSTLVITVERIRASFVLKLASLSCQKKDDFQPEENEEICARDAYSRGSEDCRENAIFWKEAVCKEAAP